MPPVVVHAIPIPAEICDLKAEHLCAPSAAEGQGEDHGPVPQPYRLFRTYLQQLLELETNSFRGIAGRDMTCRVPRAPSSTETRDLGTGDVPETVRAEAPGCASSTADVDL